jgi:cytochrome c553
MKVRPTLAALGLGVVAIGFMYGASAEDDSSPGKTVAYTCHGCHGIPNYKNTYPTYSVPKLGGQHPVYLVNALKAYASGERSHPTMHTQAASLSDQDRADVAAYLSGAPVASTGQVVGTPPPATQTCVSCHGADGAKTVGNDYPILAGQYRDYLLQALKDYKSGKRKNPIMAGIIGAVDERDFEAIAEFFSHQTVLCSTDQIREQGKCR